MCDKPLNLKGYEFVGKPFLLILDERKPGYDYYELLISMSNVVGALYSITKKLAEREINILTGMHTQFGDRILWISFIEVPQSVFIEGSLEEISSMDVVSELKYQKMGRIDKFDKFLFPLYLFDSERMIVLTDYMFYSFKKIIIDVLKTGGEFIIYMQGLNSGKATISRLKESFKEESNTIEDSLHIAENAFRAFGWGIIEFQEINPKTKTGSIIVRESMECVDSSKIKCHFIRGFITGMLMKIFNDETIKIMEEKCRSEGDSQCEYRFA